MTTWLNKIIVSLGYLVAIVIIFVALLVSMGKLLTPVLNKHLPEIEAWSSQLLQTPVKIRHVNISWNYLEPELSIQNVVLLDKKTQQPKIAIRTVTVNISIFRSLISWKLLPQTIQVSGMHLTINELSGNRFDIEKLTTLSLTDQVTGAPSTVNDLLAWIFTQPKLGLQDIDITYHSLDGQVMSISLNNLDLSNSSNTHKLLGDAVLNQAIPLQALINLNWQGSVTDLKHASVELYLYLKGVSFPQWFSKQSWQNLQVKQGLGSAKVWAFWENNQWQKIQSELQIYNLQVESNITNKTQQISRLNGHFGWKREGMRQIFAGEDIFIDLPNHLWPSTQFKIAVLPAADGSYILQEINTGYLDVMDIQQIALASGVLSEQWKKTIVALNPKGEIFQFKCVLPTGLIPDIDKNIFSAQFVNLSLNAWDKFPGISHFSGMLNWQEKAGEFKLNSSGAKVSLDSVFANPLQFKQLQGTVFVQKAEDGTWSFNTNNFQANNEDIKTKTNLKMSFPKNASASIDLSADFNVLHVEHVSHYLPLKLFDPELKDWLTKAFSSGQLESGKAVFKGRLADYPFEKGNGEFLVTGTIKDLDLTYDPNWPAIRRLNGALAFSDDSFMVDVISGQILNAPLKQVHGIISNLSKEDPLILNVAGMLDADLSQVMHFIQSSPLKKTIGTDLGELQLSGPMQLKLALTIPLDKPAETKVQGDAVLQNGRLFMPTWNLSLDQLKGNLHFTEEDITSNEMQGSLLGEAASLNLTTQYEDKKPLYLKAIVRSMVSVGELETWLKMSLSELVQGAMQYQAELHLASHESKLPSEILLRSDLKGIIVNLPEPYGKTANQERNLACNILLNPNKVVLTKIQYGDVLSAALGFQRQKSNLQFLGGELQLGKNEAKYTGQKGLVVAAEFKQLDWAMMKSYYDWVMTKNSNKATSIGSLQLSSGLLRGVNVKADVVDLFGVKLNKADIQVLKNPDNWSMNVNSEQLAGMIKIAMNLSSIQGKLKYFYFTPTNEKIAKIDPKTLPALSLSINDFHYANKNLGAVVLNTSPSRTGMSIKNFQIQSSLSQLNASGSWQLTKGAYSSHLQGNFMTTRLSEMLTQLGWGTKGLIGKNGNAKFTLTWADAPYSPTVVGLSGELSLRLGEGRIVNLGDSTDAKIGIGRLLNLLSLQSIPRRLSLNFSDLSERGYSFDIMQGNFYFKNGNAYTSNTYFNGPVAKVDIAGRIGLQTKDYDMMLSITPYVTSSLPLVATIASGGNPLVGAAAWMVDKVVGKAVSQLTTYRYKITGSWDNPSWEQGASSRKSR